MTWLLGYALIALVVMLLEDKYSPEGTPVWLPILFGVLWPLHYIAFACYFIAEMVNHNE